MISDRLLVTAVRWFLGSLAALPRQIAYPWAETLGEVVYHLDRKHRHVGMVNLGIAFPSASRRERRWILKTSYRVQGIHAVELAWLARARAEDIGERVGYEPGRGLEHYLHARQTGKGVLFLTAHIGAWELLPAAHAVLGHPLSFVVRPLESPGLDAWATGLRERFGNRVIAKYGSLRHLLRELETGGDVGLLIDQNVQPKDGVFVPFFGHPACTAATPALLALRTGCPVIAGFLIPGAEKGRYLIRFYPPLEISHTGDRERDVRENTARFNLAIESVIREFPHCWLWGHRRFGTQPDGRDIYASGHA